MTGAGTITVGLMAGGFVTPAGQEADAQIAAILAGRALWRRHPRWIGSDGQRQMLCALPGLADMTDTPARLAQLLHSAFAECRKDQLARFGRTVAAPMLLVLPQMIARHPPFAGAFMAAASTLGFSGLGEVSVAIGDAATGLALLSGTGLSGPCYIAAVDCLVTPLALDMRQAQGRGRDRHERWNPIPSEGAACLLVAPAGLSGDTAGIAGHARLALTRESWRISDPQRGLLGRGLNAAIGQACGDRPAVSRVFSDAMTERWRAEELGVVKSERPALSEDVTDWHFPGQSLGDMGAANGLAALAVALRMPGASLVLASDTDGARAAALVSMPPAG